MLLLSIKIIFFLTIVFCSPIIFTSGIVGNFGDIYQYAAPFRYFSTLNLQKGIVPLWNPHLFAGTPFLASPQSALFYPLSNFFYFFPIHYAFNFFTFFHIFMNGLGMFLLLKSLNRSHISSLWGSMAWSFSFYFLSKCTAGHVIHLSGYCWVPYILTFAIRTVKNNEKTLSLPFLCLLTSSLLQFFSGHIQVWLLTHIFLAILLLWKLAKEWKKKKNFYFNLTSTFIICFIALSLVQSFPTLTYISQSTRFKPREIFTAQSVYDFATSYSMHWKNFVGFLVPNFFGTPMEKNYIDPDHPSLYFETNAIYFGILPFILSVAGLFILLRRKNYFLPVLSLLFLTLAAGKYSPVYNYIWQGLDFLRVPARFFLLIFIPLILMSTFAWDMLLKNRSSIFKIILLFFMTADLFFNGKQFLWSEDPLQKIGKSPPIEWLQRQNAQGLKQPKRMRLDSLFRIFTVQEIGNPNKAMFFQLQNTNGYEAILQKSLLNYFGHSQGNAAILTTGVDVTNPCKKSFQLTATKYLLTTPSFKLDLPIRYQDKNLKIYENSNVLFPVQVTFSLRKFSNLESLFAFTESKNFEPTREIVQFVPGKETPDQVGIEETLPAKEVQLLNFEKINPNRIEMKWKNHDHNPFWIFLSEAFYPGWEVWSESGNRIIPFRANGYFQGIRFSQMKLPEERVFWLFRPKDFIIGAWTSIFSIIILLCAFAGLITKSASIMAE